MEPRGATASYDAANDSYFLRCCSQSARALRDGVAPSWAFPNQRLRVVTEDVGGAFGLKTGPYPEYLAILVAARKVGRPVHWMSNRAEAFLSDNHARDAFSDVELALDERGKFLALRVCHLGNMGAYIGAVGANIQTVNLTRCLPGMYDIPRIDIAVRCVFTNTTPTAPYRGAGRPEANFMLERVIDEAARVTGIDAVKLRRRNFIKPSAMPTRPRSARPSTAATSRPCSTRRWRSPTTTASSSAGARRPSAANIAASAFPACWSMPAVFRSKAPR